MTWRRFMVLLNGLSPHSATVAALKARHYIGDRHQQKVNAVEGPKAAQAAFVALFSPSKKPARA